MRTRTYELNVKNGSMNVRAVECAMTYIISENHVSPYCQIRRVCIYIYENEGKNNDINLPNKRDSLRSWRIIRSEVDHPVPDRRS